RVHEDGWVVCRAAPIDDGQVGKTALQLAQEPCLRGVETVLLTTILDCGPERWQDPDDGDAARGGQPKKTLQVILVDRMAGPVGKELLASSSDIQAGVFPLGVANDQLCSIVAPPVTQYDH